MQLITKFWHGYMFFDKGDFDDWCIFLKTQKATLQNSMCIPMKSGHGPKDYKIFKVLEAVAGEHGRERVYNDYVKIYDKTTDTVNPEVLTLIKDLAYKYHDPDTVEVLYCFLYTCMIAEFHKARSKLNKRIKRLAVHQLLIEGQSIIYVTNFSKKRRANFNKWRGSRSLNEECKMRGF